MTPIIVMAPPSSRPAMPRSPIVMARASIVMARRVRATYRGTMPKQVAPTQTIGQGAKSFQ
jgi:hypothetical protein